LALSAIVTRANGGARFSPKVISGITGTIWRQQKNRPSFAGIRGLRGHVGSSQLISLLSLKKRAKIGFMGHNKGRDNVKKRAKRRKKTERLALAKKNKRKAEK